MQSVLFAHGGPGLNSYAELGVIQPKLAEKNMNWNEWHEPSTLRTSGDAWSEEAPFANSLKSFTSKLNSIDGKVHVVGHSFGAGIALLAAQANPAKVARVSLIAPAICYYETYVRLMKLAYGDLEMANHPGCERLADAIERTTALCDEEMLAGLEIALQDPALLGHYWKRKEALQLAASFLAKPEAQVDGPGFFAVVQDVARTHGNRLKLENWLEMDVRVLWGSDDPVCNKEEESTHLRALGITFSETTLDASHYVHLDDVDGAVAWLTAE
jgi:pimeloyl-ACP methyl ester carboxylesterase